MKTSGDWVVCPHCGGEIQRTAAACRHCGSDDRTGWSEDTYLDGVDLPGEGEYEEGLEREGFRKAKGKGNGSLGIAAVSLVLILLFGAWLLLNFR